MLDYTPKYGNCYTFNSIDNDNDTDVPRRASLTGRDYGKFLVLWLKTESMNVDKGPDLLSVVYCLGHALKTVGRKYSLFLLSGLN